MIAEIVLFAPDRFAALPSSAGQGGNLPQHPFFFSVSQLVQLVFHPLAPGAFIPGMQGFTQRPQMLTGVIEVQELVRVRPAISRLERHHQVPRTTKSTHWRRTYSAHTVAQTRDVTHGRCVACVNVAPARAASCAMWMLDL